MPPKPCCQDGAYCMEPQCLSWETMCSGRTGASAWADRSGWESCTGFLAVVLG